MVYAIFLLDISLSAQKNVLCHIVYINGKWA